MYTILNMCVFITGETALEQDMERFEASFPCDGNCVGAIEDLYCHHTIVSWGEDASNIPKPCKFSSKTVSPVMNTP